MQDTTELLPKSREYFRKFLLTHKEEIRDGVREYRVGPGTGYSYFYRSDELIQCLRNIFHNLDETFGNLTIPGEFTSPKHLVTTWQWFYKYLIEEEDLIKEIYEKLTTDAKEKYGEDFEHLRKSGMIYPLPFNGIVQIHGEVKDCLNYILNLDEVLHYIEPNKNVPKKENSQFTSEEGELKSKIPSDSIFDIAIITAIYEPELRRVKEIISNPKKLVIQDDPTIYTTGTITRFNGEQINVVIASDDKMGMAGAATLATKMIFNFNPKYLVMLGICAGIKGKVKEGDIIVNELVWDYGSGKHIKIETSPGNFKEVFKPYINQINLDITLESIFKNVIFDNLYTSEIKQNWEKSNKVLSPEVTAVFGPFASGSAVIANDNIVSTINEHHGKLLGFDMEAYSIFYSCRYTSSNKTKAIVLKSVSDYGDGNKDNPDKDLLQDFAAFTSAQYFLQLAINDLNY
jgi:nucleoside phosphorylase